MTWRLENCDKENPPKWQKDDLVSGVTAKLAAYMDRELGGSAPHQCRQADMVWTARCRDGAMSCCWLWLLCAYLSFLVDGKLGCWPRRVSPSGLQRTGRRAELLGVKLGFPRSYCRAVVSDVLCVRSYVHFVCVCVYVCMCVCVRTCIYVYMCRCVCI